MAGTIVNGKLYQVGHMNNVSYKILSIENGILTFDGVLDSAYSHYCFVTPSHPSYPWLENGAKGKLICTSKEFDGADVVYKLVESGVSSISVTDAELKKYKMSVGDYVTFLESPHYIIGTVAKNTESQTITLKKPTALQNEKCIVARAAWARQDKSIISMYGVSD